MQDVFNQQVTYGGSLTASMARVTFGGIPSSLGVLMQSLQAQYQQPITRIWDLSTQNTYYIAGRPSGTAGAQRIVGPSVVVDTFYSQYGNVCNAANNNITVSANPGDCTATGAIAAISGNASQFTFYNVVASNFGISVAAEQMVINENVQMMYSALAFTSSSGASAGAAGSNGGNVA